MGKSKNLLSHQKEFGDNPHFLTSLQIIILGKKIARQVNFINNVYS